MPFHLALCSLALILQSFFAVALMPFPKCDTSETSLIAIVPEGTITIPYSAFAGCDSLSSITIPSTVTSIESAAFISCSNLTIVTIIGKGIIDVGEKAFFRNFNLQYINTSSPDISEAIIRSCDGTCSNAKQLAIGTDNSYLPIYKLPPCQTKVIVPSGVVSLSSQSYYQCSRLVSVFLPDTVVSIGDFAFYQCTSLISISISSNLSYIGAQAFQGCSSLVCFSIPPLNSKKENTMPFLSPLVLDVWAFHDCVSLGYVELRKNITLGYQVFLYASQLQCVKTESTSIFESVASSCLQPDGSTCPSARQCALSISGELSPSPTTSPVELLSAVPAFRPSYTPSFRPVPLPPTLTPSLTTSGPTKNPTGSVPVSLRPAETPTPTASSVPVSSRPTVTPTFAVTFRAEAVLKINQEIVGINASAFTSRKRNSDAFISAVKTFYLFSGVSTSTITEIRILSSVPNTETRRTLYSTTIGKFISASSTEAASINYTVATNIEISYAKNISVSSFSDDVRRSVNNRSQSMIAAVKAGRFTGLLRTYSLALNGTLNAVTVQKAPYILSQSIKMTAQISQPSATYQPSSLPTLQPTWNSCPAFSVSRTSDATYNYALCGVYACSHSIIAVDGCSSSCIGAQTLALYGNNLSTIPLITSQSCGPGPYVNCAKLTFNTTFSNCQVYRLHEGCIGQTACSGRLSVNVFAPGGGRGGGGGSIIRSVIAPTVKPTGAPSPAPPQPLTIALSTAFNVLLPVAFIAGVLLALVLMLRRNSLSEEINRLTWGKTVFSTGVSLATIVSDIFFTIAMFSIDGIDSIGYTMLSIICLKFSLACCLLYLCLTIHSRFSLAAHLVLPSQQVNSLVVIVFLLMIVAADQIVFLPWRKTAFATRALGFPKLWVLKVCLYSNLLRSGCVGVCSISYAIFRDATSAAGGSSGIVLTSILFATFSTLFNGLMLYVAIFAEKVQRYDVSLKLDGVDADEVLLPRDGDEVNDAGRGSGDGVQRFVDVEGEGDMEYPDDSRMRVILDATEDVFVLDSFEQGQLEQVDESDYADEVIINGDSDDGNSDGDNDDDNDGDSDGNNDFGIPGENVVDKLNLTEYDDSSSDYYSNETEERLQSKSIRHTASGESLFVTTQSYPDENLAVLKEQLAAFGAQPLEFIPLEDIEAEISVLLVAIRENKPFDEERFDYLMRCREVNPDFKVKKEEEAKRWREEIGQLASSSLLTMRGFVPPNIFTVSKSELLGLGMSDALAKRILTKRCLWLIRMSPEYIGKLHEADLFHKFSPQSQNLDIVEVAAIYASVPATFNSDASGKKQKWRQSIEEQLKLMAKKRGEEKLNKNETRNIVYSVSAEIFEDRETVYRPSIQSNDGLNVKYSYEESSKLRRISRLGSRSSDGGFSVISFDDQEATSSPTVGENVVASPGENSGTTFAPHQMRVKRHSWVTDNSATMSGDDSTTNNLYQHMRPKRHSLLVNPSNTSDELSPWMQQYARSRRVFVTHSEDEMRHASAVTRPDDDAPPQHRTSSSPRNQSGDAAVESVNGHVSRNRASISAALSAAITAKVAARSIWEDSTVKRATSGEDDITYNVYDQSRMALSAAIAAKAASRNSAKGDEKKETDAGGRVLNITGSSVL